MTLIGVAVILPQQAAAHKVVVFAWVENGMVHTQSGFGSKRKAKDSLILVKDDSGSILLEGRTDDQGMFSFKIPEHIPSDLHIILEAGTGHRGTWKIDRQELVSGNDPGTGRTVDVDNAPEQGVSMTKVLMGIGIILLMAVIARFLTRKKTAND